METCDSGKKVGHEGRRDHWVGPKKMDAADKPDESPDLKRSNPGVDWSVPYCGSCKREECVVDFHLSDMLEKIEDVRSNGWNFRESRAILGQFFRNRMQGRKKKSSKRNPLPRCVVKQIRYQFPDPRTEQEIW